jgi:hypothetical protein
MHPLMEEETGKPGTKELSNFRLGNAGLPWCMIPAKIYSVHSTLLNRDVS